MSPAPRPVHRPGLRTATPNAGARLDEVERLHRALFTRAAALSAAVRKALRAAQPTWWRDDAACAGLDSRAWFPCEPHIAPPGPVGVCAGCPVRRACLAFAVEFDERHGIWAGLPPTRLHALRQAVEQAVTRAEVDALLTAALAAASSGRATS